MQDVENHPLLDIDEFHARLQALGHNTMVAGNLFGALTRHTLWNSELRTSEDVGYREIDRAGVEERMVSIPNLALALSRHEKIHNVAGKLTAVCGQLIESFGLNIPNSPS